jgi:hypothetical protein
MIPIFCDVRKFLAKKIGVFLKIQCYDPIFEKLGVVGAKKIAKFVANFWAKIYLKS